MRTAPPSTGRGRRAFTLLELLLATAIFAIVLVAINTVFYSALRLRDRTTAAVAAELPVNQAMAVLRRDLVGAMPPGGTLVGDFKSGTGSSAVVNRNSSSGSTTGAAMAQPSTLSAADVGSLDFFTTGGVSRAGSTVMNTGRSFAAFGPSLSIASATALRVVGQTSGQNV